MEVDGIQGVGHGSPEGPLRHRRQQPCIEPAPFRFAGNEQLGQQGRGQSVHYLRQVPRAPRFIHAGQRQDLFRVRVDRYNSRLLLPAQGIQHLPRLRDAAVPEQAAQPRRHGDDLPDLGGPIADHDPVFADCEGIPILHAGVTPPWLCGQRFLWPRLLYRPRCNTVNEKIYNIKINNKLPIFLLTL